LLLSKGREYVFIQVCNVFSLMPKPDKPEPKRVN